MPQLVDLNCSVCRESIIGIDAGRFCPDCRRPVHRKCEGPTSLEGSCRVCGAAAIEGGLTEGFADDRTGDSAPFFFAQWLSPQGRASRSQYFTHSVVSGAALIGMTYLIGAAGALGNLGPLVAFAGFLVMLVVGGWSEMTVTVKRLHDLNRPGWHWLLGLVPVYNIFLGFELLLMPGTNGKNDYGPDPLLADASEGDSLLMMANRHEMNGDWCLAFDAYKQASEKLRGQPNEDYALECIKRLHEKVMLKGGSAR